MQKQSNNPTFTLPFRIVTIAELLVVGLAGAILYVPIIAKYQWPWSITPFNMLFLGGAYFSSLATMAIMLIGGRWAPARLGLWMLSAFTVPILLLSLTHLDRFDFQRIATPVWFFLFITIAPYSIFNIWQQRHLAPANPVRLSVFWRQFLLLQGIALVLYCIALLVAPTFSSAFWPWKIDEFHGRVYSAIFLTGGVGSLVLWRSAASIELLMLGMTELVLGFFSLLGLLLADASLHRVNWSLAGAWVWIGIFTVFFIAGLGLIRLALIRSPSLEKAAIEV